MLDLLNFVPGEPRGIFDRIPELWIGVAVGHDVKPIAISAILGNTALVWSEEHGPGRGTDTFDLDEP